MSVKPFLERIVIPWRWCRQVGSPAASQDVSQVVKLEQLALGMMGDGVGEGVDDKTEGWESKWWWLWWWWCEGRG